MTNIASYQEGYTDGYQDGKNTCSTRYKHLLNEFINEQMEDNPYKPYLEGYNMALKDLKEFIEVL